jgi:hypothetical protein
MPKEYKGFLLGFLATAGLALFLGAKYGSWCEKIGRLEGHKDGNIEVVDFLARHFPVPNGVTVPEDHEFSTKWYRVLVTDSNGISTLRIQNEL